jgi:DNA-binding response OmpR family regulator
MTTILVVTDEPWVRNEVHAGLTAPGFTLIDHSEPATAAAAARDESVDVVVVDMQVGSMGGMAITRAVREATGTEESKGIPVVMLLDRDADAFLAGRAGADAWVAKPFTSHELTTQVDQLTGTPEEPGTG